MRVRSVHIIANSPSAGKVVRDYLDQMPGKPPRTLHSST
jgi:hypothetical protein